MVSKIPNGWQATTLGEQLEAILGGGTPSRSLPEYWGGPIPWASVKDFNGCRILHSTAHSITKTGLEKSASRMVPKGTVLLATRMAVGATSIAGNAMAINQDLKALTPKDTLDPGYLFHFLRWRSRDLAASGAGTTVEGIGISTVRTLPLLLPPKAEQRSIAAILDSIDEAIERTEEVIAATEELRKALLQDLLTRGIPGWHTEWTDVPGLGTIPADWEVIRLGDCGQWFSGGTPSKSNVTYWNGTIPWISPRDMKKRIITDTIHHISAEGAASGSRTVPAEAIFVVVRGMILAHSFPVASSTTPCAFNQDIKALVCSDEMYPLFVLAAFERFRDKLLELVTPSTHGTMRIVMEELFDIYIPRPRKDEQRLIADTLGNLDSRLEKEIAVLDSLHQMKHSASEALLSGLVRVPVVQ